MGCPSGIDVATVLESDDHPADILLLKGGTAQEPLRDVLIQSILQHGVRALR